MSFSAPSRLDTRRKLLEAAGEVFARTGFRAATIQEICERAGANIAAVNYHFRDKLSLYREVLRYAERSTHEAAPDVQSLREMPAERALGLFINGLLQHLFGEGRPSWFAQLMAHELAEPTPALDQLIEDEVKPAFEQLKTIVRKIVGKPISAEMALMCANSVVGQCLHYFHSRRVVARLWPDLRMNAQRIEQIARHITTFSIAALKQIGPTDIRAQGRGGPQSQPGVRRRRSPHPREV